MRHGETIGFTYRTKVSYINGIHLISHIITKKIAKELAVVVKKTTGIASKDPANSSSREGPQ